MTTALAPTVLTQEQRDALAADFSYGGGNLLQAAIAANPHPEVPFIHPARPLRGHRRRAAARAQPARPRRARPELVVVVPR